MRALLVAGWVFTLALPFAYGCRRHRAPATTNQPHNGAYGAGYGDPYGYGSGGAAPNGGNGGNASNAAPGTCESSCTHYLQCKGIYDPNAYPACLNKCRPMNLTRDQLLRFESLDCPTAVYEAEHSGGGKAGTAGGASNACSGCVWDGSACMWYSQSNWGAGPYSGAATGCDAKCCPGH
jgi:hypothetical protein